MTEKITIFKNISETDTPYYITISQALNRIKTGVSKQKVELVRGQLDKERANAIKKTLPSVCFSGTFSSRNDLSLQKHSGYMVLDLDLVEDVEATKKKWADFFFTLATWASPSGNGVKVLIKISEPISHRNHFTAILRKHPEIDKSGINVSRVCYESYDPEIIINEKVVAFTEKVKEKAEKATINEQVVGNETFENILKWLANRNDAFIKGERNIFMFKLASACCRFGMPKDECLGYIESRYPTENDFTQRELTTVVNSAYKSNTHLFGSAVFEKEHLVDKSSKSEVEIEVNDDFYDRTIKPKDVVFGEDVKDLAMKIFDNGYESVKEVGIRELDELFKLKKCESTLLSGIGNYGKTSFLMWYLLLRSILFGEKFAFFTPEQQPEEFYNDIVEMMFGRACSKPINPNFADTRPGREDYSNIYDVISQHFFYVYPKELAPTPEYIKSRFLELIIKQDVVGCIIDPFNQLANDYKTAGGRSDKYLETFLSDWGRFAQSNNIYSIIVAHPTKLRKDGANNYPCPDVFDIADGAMWNNKMDNILIYHRPNHQVDASDPTCELHTKKIRRQKIVGLKGTATFEYDRIKRRYLFDKKDYLQIAIDSLS